MEKKSIKKKIIQKNIESVNVKDIKPIENFIEESRIVNLNNITLSENFVIDQDRIVYLEENENEIESESTNSSTRLDDNLNESESERINSSIKLDDNLNESESESINSSIKLDDNLNESESESINSSIKLDDNLNESESESVNSIVKLDDDINKDILEHSNLNVDKENIYIFNVMQKKGVLSPLKSLKYFLNNNLSMMELKNIYKKNNIELSQNISIKDFLLLSHSLNDLKSKKSSFY